MRRGRVIKVFISYKTDDYLTALTVKSAIERHNNFDTYLDRVDDSLLKDDPALAERLLQRIDDCDQLLAVVSCTTVESWWVPWEIGVASGKHYLLATYLQDEVELPEYLSRWPVLRSAAAIDQYCSFSRNLAEHRERLLTEDLALDKRQAVNARLATIFHTRLRKALGQV